jgi:hypothetical protein
MDEIIKATTILCLLTGTIVLLSGCQRESPPKSSSDESLFRKPTATEVFNLRTKCAELGQKILKGHLTGPPFKQDQVSHYNPKTNRCYVELSEGLADPGKYLDNYSRFLYDGQTGELLASVHDGNGGRTAFVKDADVDITNYNAAIQRIESLMADDRKQ